MLETFRTDDIDAAREVGSRLFYDHRTAPTRPGGKFSYELRAGQIGALTAGLVRYGLETRIAICATEANYSVNIGLDGAVDVHTANEDVTIGSATAAISGPTDDLHAKGWATGHESAILLAFDRSALEWELRQILGRDVVGPIRFAPKFDMSRGRGAQWWSLARSLGPALNQPDALVWNPLIGAPLGRSLMAGLLLASEHQYRDLLETSPQPLTPAAIRRAVATIEERAHEPIAISDVAGQVGCSVRSLRTAFRNQMGMTVQSYVIRVRLDRARADLVGLTTPGTSVSEVARRWGFGDLAAFSVLYEREYGEEPGRTLMRH